MTRRSRAELMLMSVTVVWGSTFVLSKILLEDLSPFVYMTIRFGIATLLFALVAHRRLRNIPRSAVVQGGILGALLFGGFAAQTVGLLYTTASKSAFITGMMVVFTPIFQLMIERRPPRLVNVLGVAIVTVGLYFLTSPAGSSFNVGDALNLVCAFIFGIYLVYMDIFAKQQSPEHLTIMQFVWTFFLALIGVATLETPRMHVTSSATSVMAYLILFPTIIALYIQAKYQKDTTPTRSAVIFSAEPVLAAGFAYLLLGEHLGTFGVLGAGLILCGVLVSEFGDLLLRVRGSTAEEEGT